MADQSDSNDKYHTMPERYAQLEWLHRKEKEYRASGNVLDLQMIRIMRKRFFEDERRYNKRDILEYIKVVSADENYPHSLKTALPEFRELLEYLD